MPTVTERWKKLLDHIDAAQKARGGEPAVLVAVSKGQPQAAVIPLLEAGQRDFGENRVQEARMKWPDLKLRYPGVRLHLIGTLQSNKAKEALTLFDVIHTVDRESLVDALVKARGEGRGAGDQAFFIQVNVGREPQKSGVAPEHLPRLLRYALAPRPSPLAPLPITGLMCIPPAGEPPAPHFMQLATCARALGLPYLSMGMTGDYETALRCGSTHVRIGTLLFGERL